MEHTFQMEGGPRTIIGSFWEKGNQRRIYFTFKGGYRNSGQACWDLNTKSWVKVHQEFGPTFKDQIAAAFNLSEMR